MSLKIEIEVKDKHTLAVHEEGDLWLFAEAGDEIINALEHIIDHYSSVFEKLKSGEYYGDHS